MLVQNIPHQELTIGMVIRNDTPNGKMTRISKIERGHCSKRGTHINDSMCFDLTAPILVGGK